MRALIKSERDALTWALHLEKVLDGAACNTGREIRRAVMKRLEACGLVEEKWCVVVDGDGWTIHPERYRLAFALTEAGRAAARAELKRRDEATAAYLAERAPPVHFNHKKRPA